MVRISIFLINELKLQHAYRVFDGGIVWNHIVLTNLYYIEKAVVLGPAKDSKHCLNEQTYPV